MKTTTHGLYNAIQFENRACPAPPCQVCGESIKRSKWGQIAKLRGQQVLFFLLFFLLFFFYFFIFFLEKRYFFVFWGGIFFWGKHFFFFFFDFFCIPNVITKTYLRLLLNTKTGLK